MSNRRKKVFIHTLGCPKNEVDSEVMAGIFQRDGLAIAATPEEADLVVVNTCSFIDTAKQESIDAILEAGQDKGHRKLLVTGCLAERYGDELLREIPEIDGLVGVRALQTVGAAAQRVLKGSPVCDRDLAWLAEEQDPLSEARLSLGTAHSAYVKIAEGCNRPCAFCSIPSFRGKLASRTVPSLVQEMRGLALRGASEIILIGQETTAYGNDRNDGSSLPALFDEIMTIEDLRWVRLMYAYPSAVSDELIDRLGQGNICSYLDMPIQHASTSVLKNMRRGMSGNVIRETVARLRERVPGLTLRTTVMVGFPGETDADVAELIEFVKEARFDHLGVFPFSPQEDTHAATLPDPVPEDVARDRQQMVLDAQEEIAYARTQRLVGTTQTVLIDEFIDGETHARTEMDAPEIDGVVTIPGYAGAPGTYLEVEIEEAYGPTLVARAPSPAGAQ